MSFLLGSWRPQAAAGSAGDDLRRMAETGLFFSTHPVESHVDGGLALAAVRRPMEASESGSAALLQDLEADLAVALDGRLDDRHELADKLGVKAESGPAGDAQLILQSYRRWGVDCAKQLTGEVTWMVWDGRQRRLVIARDLFGLRPLFYRWDRQHLLFASQLAQVARAANLGESDISEQFISDFLIAGKGYRGTTPWRGVQSLAPGHLLLLEDNRLTIRPHYELEDAPKLHLKDSDAYASRFRELFQRAVGQRMPEGETVWSDLSGGLDSSSVVSVAAQELKRRGLAATQSFRTFSWTHEESPKSDEWKWAQSVLEHYGLEGFKLNGHDLPFFHQAQHGARYWDLPSLEIMGYAHHEKMATLLLNSQVNGLLKGLGAEMVVFYASMPPLHLPDLLRSFRFRQFFQDLASWQQRFREPLLPLAWRYGLKPLVDPGSIAYQAQGGIPAWVAPDLARRYQMKQRAFRAWMPKRFRRTADQWQYEQIGRMAGSLHPGLLHKVTDVRLPFLYRPLVEFSLRTPWEEKVQLGQDKILLRNAMRGILPPLIQNRRRIVNGNAAVHLGLRRHWSQIEQILNEGHLARWGMIDADTLRSSLRLAYHGGWKFLPGLLRPVALEAWLSAHLSQQPFQEASLAA